MKSNKSTSLFSRELVLESLKQSFVKLDPRMMVRNPVMFIVEVCTALMIVATLYFLFAGVTDQGAFGYNVAVSVILFVTLLFANFAEAIAEARGKGAGRQPAKDEGGDPGQAGGERDDPGGEQFPVEERRCFRVRGGRRDPF